MERKKCPLVEVISEYHFPSNYYSDDKAAEFIKIIESDFPVKKDLNIFQQHNEITEKGQSQNTTNSKRKQFYSTDDTLVIQLDNNLLTINHREPYSNWIQFSGIINDVFNNFINIFGTCTFPTIKLHYLNRIDIVGDRINIDDYFEFRPVFEEEFLNFQASAVIIWKETESIIQKTINNLIPDFENKIFSFALAFAAQKNNINSDDVLAWLDKAHIKLDEQFQVSIKQPTKDLYTF